MDGGVAGFAEVTEGAAEAALEAERAVIACVLCDVNGSECAYDRAAVTLRAESFGNRFAVSVWSAMAHVRERGYAPDSAMVAERLAELRESAAIKYLGEVAGIIIDPRGIDRYVEAVAKRAFLRVTMERVREAYEELKKPCDPVEAVNNARAVLKNIPADVDGARDDSALTGASEVIDDIIKASERGQHSGALYGVPSLDGYATRDGWEEGAIGGMYGGELHIIGGVPAAGKTALCIRAAINNARRWVTTAPGEKQRVALYFSLEMPRRNLLRRTASMELGIPSKKIKSGRLNQTEMNDLFAKANDYGTLPLYIIDTARTLEAIRARVLAESARREVGLVVVDYLQLVGMERVYRDDNRADADRVQGFKMLANDANAPVVAITAMTKAAQREAADGKVDQTAAKGSGAEYAADTTAFLIRTNPKDTRPEVEVVFAMTKCRDGEVMRPTLMFEKARGIFRSGSKNYDGPLPEDDGTDAL
jgi:replicative DNA helicase